MSRDPEASFSAFELRVLFESKRKKLLRGGVEKANGQCIFDAEVFSARDG